MKLLTKIKVSDGLKKEKNSFYLIFSMLMLGELSLRKRLTQVIMKNVMNSKISELSRILFNASAGKTSDKYNVNRKKDKT